MDNTILNIFNNVDHTNLKKTACKTDIEKLCKEAVANGAKSVCVQPCYVSYAKNLLENEAPLVCTVIGFPNGYHTTNVKKSETIEAIFDGADEVDMVINNCWLKDKEYDKIRNEIKELATICHDGQCSEKRITLKVIIETCLLTEDEIELMCEICLEAGADYIKTSTGFDAKGAQLEHIYLMANVIGGRGLKIKASGGIRTIQDADNMIKAGADRIGASSLFNGIN